MAKVASEDHPKPVEMQMSDDLAPIPPRQPRGRPFEKGRSGYPGGRRAGSRNKKTLAAMALLEGEAEGLTRKAVELAMRGDPAALRLCLERILPPCRERAVKFALPPIESAATTHRGVLLQSRCRSASPLVLAQFKIAGKARPFLSYAGPVGVDSPAPQGLASP